MLGEVPSTILGGEGMEVREAEVKVGSIDFWNLRLCELLVGGGMDF